MSFQRESQKKKNARILTRLYSLLLYRWPLRFLRTPTGIIPPNKWKHLTNFYHGTTLPTIKAFLIHRKDKTSRAMANRCWCFNTLFFAETSAIDNAKTPNITNLHALVANQSPFFVTRVALLWKYQERDGSFLSEQGIVKCGELIYFFI